MDIIEINLLPEEMRREKKPKMEFHLEVGKVKFLLWGFIACALVTVLFFATGSYIRKKQIAGLVIKEQSLGSKRVEVEELNKQIAILKGRMSSLEGIVERKFLWAQKLNVLSDLVLPEIWLTCIKTDLENRFIIEGSIPSRREEAMASVGKFMKNMRDSQIFFQGFENINLDSVQRKTLGDRDLVDFIITLRFKEDNGS